MTPTLLLAVCLGLTIGAVIVQMLVRRRQMHALARLANETGLHYSATDHLGLARRIADQFPEPGAMDLQAFDLIYGRSGHNHHFIFTTDYTLYRGGYGRRLRQVCSLIDPSSVPAPPVLKLAPPELPRVEQYQFLIQQPASDVSPAEQNRKTFP